jgi:hypothetical protein
MIGAGGGAGESSRARVSSAWVKFKEMVQILKKKTVVKLNVKGKKYNTSVCSECCIGETWPMRTEDPQHLERAEHMMRRWMCGVRLADKRPTIELSMSVEVEQVAVVVRCG